MKTDVSLRILNLSDCSQVAIVHKRAFPKSSLTKLGTEAVRRYYASQMNPNNNCHALGAFVNNTMIGFVFAGIFHGILTGYVNDNRWFLIGRVLTHPWLVFNPMFREATKLALSKFRQKKQSVINTASKKKDFVLLSIAVDPREQQNGVGQVLMEYVEKEAINHGYTKMSLTVNPLNVGALRFYEKNNWVKTNNHFGKNIEMIKQLR